MHLQLRYTEVTECSVLFSKARIKYCLIHFGNIIVLTSFIDYLYFTDWVLLSVLRANKNNADDVVVLRKDIPKPMGIIAVGNQTVSCKWNSKALERDILIY